MKLLIVGAGEMGRWLADTVDADVAFTDADPAVAEAAADPRAARAVPSDTEEFFDAVGIAVPMSVVDEAIATYAPLAEAAVFDLSGVMDRPLAAMADHAPDCEQASFHPLFAPPRVPGNIAVVTATAGPTLATIHEHMSEAGNTVFETTAAEHDSAMETIQAGAHTAVLAYALVAGDSREEFATPVSERLESLATTVTEGSPEVYGEIQAAFDGADDIAAAAQRIADADSETFADLYAEAKRNVDADSRVTDE